MGLSSSVLCELKVTPKHELAQALEQLGEDPEVEKDKGLPEGGPCQLRLKSEG